MAVKKTSEDEIEELRGAIAQLGSSENEFLERFVLEGDDYLTDLEVTKAVGKYRKNFQRKSLNYSVYEAMLAFVSEIGNESNSDQVICNAVKNSIEHTGLEQLMSDISKKVWKNNKS